ncbi:MAG: IS110 family transposase [Pseudomonadota bacterium]
MQYYIGLDVSLAETSVCVVDRDGTIVREAKVHSDPDDLAAYIRDLDLPFHRIGMETGQLSNWLYHGMRDADLPIICVESHHMSTALKAQRVKTDQNDARGIAHMMRVGWYKEVHVKSPENSRYRVILNNRRWLIGRKIDLGNQIRGNLKTFGYKMGRVHWRHNFEKRVYELLAEDEALLSIIKPMLRARAILICEIADLERQIRKIVRKDPVCRRLMTIPGIGPMNALAFVSSIDNPHIFRRSRDVGAFFGLTPSKYASGEVDRTGSITKAGDSLVRTYLYEAANVLMTRLRKPCGLRTWALELVKRSSERKARVALARKLAVIMHRMWIDGTTFSWGNVAADSPA